jgi:predicted TIM-barrel fold metal-dependent hydrolase
LIVDGLTILGTSINGYQLKADELLASMDSNGIDTSVVVPVQPKTYRLESQNAAVAVTQMRYPEHFIGFCRIDPRQGEDAITELRRCVLQLGLKGLMLHPMEEGYTINEEHAVRLVKEAGSLGVPTIIAAGYPWVAHALQIRCVAEQAEETTIIMSHGGQINISGLAQADAFLAMETCSNLYIGTNGVYRQDFLEECVEAFGSERVLFTSMSPVFHQGFELDRVRSVKMEEVDRRSVLGGNIIRILEAAGRGSSRGV